jgi:hypothetical protein
MTYYLMVQRQVLGQKLQVLEQVVHHQLEEVVVHRQQVEVEVEVEDLQHLLVGEVVHLYLPVLELELELELVVVQQQGLGQQVHLIHYFHLLLKHFVVFS